MRQFQITILTLLFLYSISIHAQDVELTFITEIDLESFEGFTAIEYKDGYLFGVDDDDAYSLSVWDLNDPANPFELSKTDNARDLNPNDMLLHGNTLFISGSGNSFGTTTTLDVWDVSDPTSPSFISTYDLFSWDGDNERRIVGLIAAQGDELIAKLSTYNMARLDISDLNNISIIGGFGDSFGQSLFGGIGRFRFTDTGTGWLDENDFRYLTFNGDGTVSSTSKTAVTGELYDFVVFGDDKEGYAVSWTTGPLWFTSLTMSTDGTVTENNMLDVSDSITAGFGATMTGYELKNLVFVGGEVSFIMVDVSTPSSPKILGKYDGGGDYIKRYGDLVITDGFADDVRIYRVDGRSDVLPPAPDFEASNTTIMAGQSITFYDSTKYEPTEWQWSFDGGSPSISTEENPTIIYNNEGNYSVTLTATNANGSNSLTKSNYITVEAVDSSIVIADFYVTDSLVLEGDSVRFSDASTGFDLEYQWIFEGGEPDSSYLRNPATLYKTEGAYDVQVIISNKFGADTLTRADFINVTWDKVLDAPSNLLALIEDDIVDLTWSDNSNDEKGFKIERAKDDGNFVELAVVDADMTEYMDDDLEAPSFYTYRIAAIRDDSISTFSNEAEIEVVLGLAEAKKITIFPVPISIDGTLTVSGLQKLNGIRELRLVDLLGKEIWESKVSLADDRYSINLKDLRLRAGVYTLIISGSEGFMGRRIRIGK